MLTSQRSQALKNRRVHFRIRDIYHPDPTSMLLALHGDDVIQGEVVAITDSGERDGVYAVVKADDLEQPVVVHLARLGGTL